MTLFISKGKIAERYVPGLSQQAREEPVAAASLAQVYLATLISFEFFPRRPLCLTPLSNNCLISLACPQACPGATRP